MIKYKCTNCSEAYEVPQKDIEHNISLAPTTKELECPHCGVDHNKYAIYFLEKKGGGSINE